MGPILGNAVLVNGNLCQPTINNVDATARPTGNLFTMRNNYQGKPLLV